MMRVGTRTDMGTFADLFVWRVPMEGGYYSQHAPEQCFLSELEVLAVLV